MFSSPPLTNIIELGEYQLALYKSLINTKEYPNESGEINLIELWDCEPYLAKKQSPKWKWNFCLIDGNVVPPILAPSNCN